MKALPLFLTLFFWSLVASAAHIAGGDLTYSCLGGNQYRITLTLYRDCNNLQSGNDDTDATIYSFNAVTDDTVHRWVLPRISSTTVPNTSPNPCVTPPSSSVVCYNIAVYQSVVTINPNQNQQGLNLSHGRCCRNGTIVNINNPGDTGMQFWSYIPPSTCNSSPAFKQPMPAFLCLNDILNFDHSAIDADGDSLAYFLTSPWTAGSPNDPKPDPTPPPYPNVSFSNGFNFLNPMGGNPALSINSQTGQLQVKPTSLGQYVFAISVFEYRNGVKIGETKRDIQVNVINCPINFAPEVNIAGGQNTTGDTLIFNAGESSCFNLNITDVNGSGIPADQLSITAAGSLLNTGATFNASNGLSPRTASVCWTPACTQIGGLSSLTITVNDNNSCPSPNIITKTIYAKVEQGNATAPNLRCVSVINSNQISLSWVNPDAPKLSGFEYYELQRNDGSGWVSIAQITDSLQTTFIDNGVSNTNIVSYCYRLATAKTCPTFFVGTFGNEVCSLLANAVQVNSVQAQLNWTVWTNWANPVYQVMAGNSLLSSETATSLRITNCSLRSDFYVRVTDPLTGCTSNSGITDSVRLQDVLPTAVDICAISVISGDSGINIRWTPNLDDDFISYRLYRSANAGNTWTLLQEELNQATLTYRDLQAKVDSISYCYKVEVKDLCGNILTSQPDCSILLNGTGENYTVFLSWKAYSGWTPNPDNLEIWNTVNGEPESLRSTPGLSATSFVEDGVDNNRSQYCYKIRQSRSTNDCNETWSNEMCFSFPPTAYFPSAFSPNGDGHNDRFLVVGLYAQSFTLDIFDRWGVKVFTTNDAILGWDGTVKNLDAPEGVYVYKARVQGYEGTIIERTGTVMLIR